MAQEKPNFCYRQSAVVPFLEEEGVLRIVLITNRSRSLWILPKGIVEKDMSPPASAAKEAVEEGGIYGDVFDEKINTFYPSKWGGVCTVSLFPLKVSKLLDQWDEGTILNTDGRTRAVFEFEEACREINPIMRPALDGFRDWYASR